MAITRRRALIGLAAVGLVAGVTLAVSAGATEDELEPAPGVEIGDRVDDVPNGDLDDLPELVPFCEGDCETVAGFLRREDIMEPPPPPPPDQEPAALVLDVYDESGDVIGEATVAPDGGLEAELDEPTTEGG